MEKYPQKTNIGKMKQKGPAALKGVHQWYQRMNPKPSVSQADPGHAGGNAEDCNAWGLGVTHGVISHFRVRSEGTEPEVCTGQ